MQFSHFSKYMGFVVAENEAYFADMSVESISQLVGYLKPNIDIWIAYMLGVQLLLFKHSVSIRHF
jgi:hypothetical protein